MEKTEASRPTHREVAKLAIEILRRHTLLTIPEATALARAQLEMVEIEEVEGDRE